MSSTTEPLIQGIHGSNIRFVLAVSGGGSGAIAQLLEVPGASRSVLEAAVPYSAPAMIAWLGARPEQFCSESTARAMAMAAYLRACRYQSGEPSAESGGRGTESGGEGFRVQGSELRVQHPEVGISGGAPIERPEPRTLNPEPSPAPRPPFPALAGVACTASLASDRPKRGPHRAHLAIQTAAMTISQSVELEKGRRTRAEEEAVVARLLLNVVARACEVPERLDPGLVEAERVSQTEVTAPASWQDLFAGRVDVVCSTGFRPVSLGAARIVFPGAFHPMHMGHRRMAEIAGERLRQRVEFEVSILNVDKPPLDFLEIQRRAAQFGPQETLWLTRAATFEAKSRFFPGATFVVGADTLRRIADPRYFGGDAAACQRAIAEIAARGCRFLVFGRQEAGRGPNEGGRFIGLSDLDLPPALLPLCQEIPASEFREDVSSTEIRRTASS